MGMGMGTVTNKSDTSEGALVQITTKIKVISSFSLFLLLFQFFCRFVRTVTRTHSTIRFPPHVI